MVDAETDELAVEVGGWDGDIVGASGGGAGGGPERGPFVQVDRGLDGVAEVGVGEAVEAEGKGVGAGG